jgi:hypothetical protein
MASRLLAIDSKGERAGVLSARRRIACSLVLAALACTGNALADPTAADKETARGLMAEGRAARDKGDLQGALKAFAAADAIMHVPTTGLELARAEAALGQLVEARDTALRVTRIPESPKEPAPFKAAREAASSLNDELEPRIPSLKILVTGVPEGYRPRVTLDGAIVPPELLGQSRKVDPGHHALVAKAGTAEGKQEIDVAEKESKEISIELPAQAPPPPEASAAPAEQPAQPAAPAPEPFVLARAMVYGGFGLAGAGIVLGSITGIVSLSTTNGIKNSGQCVGDTCGPAEYNDISSANAMATISTVSFAAAGVGVVAGVVGLLLQSPHAPANPDVQTARVEPSVVPWVGVGSAGVSGRF